MSDDAVDKATRQTARTEQSDVRGQDVGLVRQETVVLLADLVESVRLMREHEASSVQRWADFVRTVIGEILPRHRGTLVKSLGDGLLARFETVPDSAAAAAEMHQTLAAQNVGMPEDRHFHLRAGINAAMAWSDGIDIYGTGVNLAARLATLAGPGETIASASAHEQLAAGLANLARPGRRSAARRRAMNSLMGWTRCAKILATASSNISTSRFAPTASGRRARGRRSQGDATMAWQCSRPLR